MHQLEGGVGRLVGPALGLAGLDRLDHPGQGRRVRGDVHAQLAALELDGRPAGHLGDQDPGVVADQRAGRCGCTAPR